jgi:hypothetical protein
LGKEQRADCIDDEDIDAEYILDEDITTYSILLEENYEVESYGEESFDEESSDDDDEDDASDDNGIDEYEAVEYVYKGEPLSINWEGVYIPKDKDGYCFPNIITKEMFLPKMTRRWLRLV